GRATDVKPFAQADENSPLKMQNVRAHSCAERDTVSPNSWNSDVVSRVFAAAIRTQTVPKADHYVFLPPCPAAFAEQAPSLCRDPEGVDRASVHQRVNDSVVSFFKRVQHQPR